MHAFIKGRQRLKYQLYYSYRRSRRHLRVITKSVIDDPLRSIIKSFGSHCDPLRDHYNVNSLWQLFGKKSKYIFLRIRNKKQDTYSEESLDTGKASCRREYKLQDAHNQESFASIIYPALSARKCCLFLSGSAGTQTGINLEIILRLNG